MIWYDVVVADTEGNMEYLGGYKTKKEALRFINSIKTDYNYIELNKYKNDEIIEIIEIK